MRYKIEEIDNYFYIMGLKEDYGDEPNTMLLYFYSSEESESPDVDPPTDIHKMFSSLYDIFQTHDGLKSGDIFETKYGEFVCEGVNVIPLFNMPEKHVKNNLIQGSSQPGNPFGDDIVLSDSEGYTD